MHVSKNANLFSKNISTKPKKSEKRSIALAKMTFLQVEKDKMRVFVTGRVLLALHAGL